ncbi:MAG: hypothetical protein QMD71_03960 [bacterium]|nr:hypothetical protein [bacterium]
MKMVEIKKREVLYMNIGGMYVAKIVGWVGSINGLRIIPINRDKVGDVSPKKGVK